MRRGLFKLLVRIARAAAVAPRVILGLAFPLAILLAGCSELTRYRVLSFFFDGVPPPGGLAVTTQPGKIIGPWGVELDPDSPLANAILEAQRRMAEQKSTEVAAQFLHAPYRKHQCTECHASQGSFQVPVNTSDLCRKCHAGHYEYPADDWVHGPRAVAPCSLCHKPHLSEYPGLLTAPQPELCFDCHDRSRTLAKAWHAGIKDRRCTECHDPHSAGNRLLLVDSTSYRRGGPRPTKPNPHAKWAKDTCGNCHQTAKSNVLIGDVNAKCIECHKDGKKPPASGEGTPARSESQPAVPRKLHKAVADGKCITCHTAHQSTQDHLIRPTAEQVCYACHKPEEIRKEAHPRVQRADCLLCHKGHVASRPDLLKDAAGAGATFDTTVSRPEKAP